MIAERHALPIGIRRCAVAVLHFVLHRDRSGGSRDPATNQKKCLFGGWEKWPICEAKRHFGGLVVQ